MADVPPNHATGLGSDAAAAARPPRTPRWVKLAGIVVAILVLAFLVMRFTGIGGDHGPNRHIGGASAKLPSIDSWPL